MKVRIDKASGKDYWYNSQIGAELFVKVENEKQYAVYVYENEFGGGNYILKSDCTVISSDTQPEPKGYCIKRTPENAEVLNKWANENGDEQILTGNHGYIHSVFYQNTVSVDTYYNDKIQEGFTELFTVEEFFAKVGYTPGSAPVEPVKEEVVAERIPFDLEKWNSGKYEAMDRDGYNVRILCTDLKGSHPIVAYNEENDSVGTHGLDGTAFNSEIEDDSDIFLIGKSISVWVNVFESEDFKSESEAKMNGIHATPTGCKYIDTIEIKRPTK